MNLKELYIDTQNELEEELNRDPTGEEIHYRYIDRICSIADYYKDAAKYGDGE